MVAETICLCFGGKCHYLHKKCCLSRRNWCKHHWCCKGGAEAVPRPHASFLQPGEDCTSHDGPHSSSWLSPSGQRATGNLPHPSDGRRKRPGHTLQRQGRAGAGELWLTFFFLELAIDLLISFFFVGMRLQRFHPSVLWYHSPHPARSGELWKSQFLRPLRSGSLSLNNQFMLRAACVHTDFLQPCTLRHAIVLLLWHLSHPVTLPPVVPQPLSAPPPPHLKNAFVLNGTYAENILFKSLDWLHAKRESQGFFFLLALTCSRK